MWECSAANSSQCPPCASVCVAPWWSRHHLITQFLVTNSVHAAALLCLQSPGPQPPCGPSHFLPGKQDSRSAAALIHLLGVSLPAASFLRAPSPLPGLCSLLCQIGVRWIGVSPSPKRFGQIHPVTYLETSLRFPLNFYFGGTQAP